MTAENKNNSTTSNNNSNKGSKWGENTSISRDASTTYSTTTNRIANKIDALQLLKYLPISPRGLHHTDITKTSNTNQLLSPPSTTSTASTSSTSANNSENSYFYFPSLSSSSLDNTSSSSSQQQQQQQPSSSNSTNTNSTSSSNFGLPPLPQFSLFSSALQDFYFVTNKKVDDLILSNSKVLLIGMTFGSAITTGIAVGLLVTGSLMPAFCRRIYKRWWRRRRRRRRNKSRSTIYRGRNEKNNENAIWSLFGYSFYRNDIDLSPSSSDIREYNDSYHSHDDDDDDDPILVEKESLQYNKVLPSIIILQGIPSTFLPIQQEQDSTSFDNNKSNTIPCNNVSRLQCQECLTSITTTLRQHSLSWNNVGRICVHLIMDQCTGATFRSVLQEYCSYASTNSSSSSSSSTATPATPATTCSDSSIGDEKNACPKIGNENMIVSIVYVQRLEYDGQCVQVEVLASR